MAIEKDIDQTKVVEYIVGKYEDWKAKRQKKEETLKACVNNYLTVIDESRYQNWPWRSKVCDTFSQEIGDSIASALRGALFPLTEEFFTIEGLDDLGLLYQDKMTDYMKQKIYESKFIERVKPFLKQIVVLGNSPAILPWKQEFKVRTRWNRRYNPVKYLQLVYDNFSFDTLDLFDVVFDPTKIYLSESPIIRRISKSKTLLKEMTNIYENLGAIDDTSSAISDESESQKRQRATLFGLEYEPDKADIELLEAYGDFEIEGKIYRNYICTVANRTILLRFEENPYWGGRPIIWGTYDNVWFTAYGRGALEPLVGIHELINTFSNQKADILNLIINGTFVYVNDGIVDPENLILRPGGAIEEGLKGNIRPLHPNTNVTLAFAEIDSLRVRGERSSGASAYEQGAIRPGKRTAYEANIIKQGSVTRFGDVSKHIGDSVIEYALNFYLESLKQFKLGSGEIEDEVLMGEYKVNYLGADLSAVKAFETQQLINFTDVLARNPMFAMAINPIEYIHELRRLMNIKNKKIVKTEEELQAMMQQFGSGNGSKSPMNQIGTQTFPMPEQGLINEYGEEITR